jgi:hypothetical protein
MAKLFVYMAGLMAVVLPKPGGRGPGRVLFRATDDETVGGLPIGLHRSRLRFRAKGEKRPRTVHLAGRDVSFSPAGEGPFEVTERSLLLTLGEFEEEPARVRAGCIGGSPDLCCTVANRAILDGRLVLTGGSLRPVRMHNVFSLEDVDPAGSVVATGLISFDGSGELPLDRRPLANGLLYEREVGDGEVMLQIGGGEPITLARENPGGLLGTEGGWIVWAVNTLDPEAGMGECSLEPFDRDFALLYDFAEGSPKRFLPSLADLACDDCPGDPPGKCMPAFLHA